MHVTVSVQVMAEAAARFTLHPAAAMINVMGLGGAALEGVPAAARA
jgi:hypothetical protein